MYKACCPTRSVINPRTLVVNADKRGLNLDGLVVASRSRCPCYLTHLPICDATGLMYGRKSDGSCLRARSGVGALGLRAGWVERCSLDMQRLDLMGAVCLCCRMDGGPPTSNLCGCYTCGLTFTIVPVVEYSGVYDIPFGQLAACFYTNCTNCESELAANQNLRIRNCEAETCWMRVGGGFGRVQVASAPRIRNCALGTARSPNHLFPGFRFQLFPSFRNSPFASFRIIRFLVSPFWFPVQASWFLLWPSCLLIF